MTLSGGGSPASTASDPTTVNALPRYSNPLAFATSASVVAGVPTTLSVTYTSDNGSADIASGQVRIDACYLLWDRSGHVVLYSPQGGHLSDSLGNSTVLSPADGGCSIDLSDSSLSTPAANPKALVLKLGITFPEQNFFSTSYSSLSPDFVGPHEVYAEAISVAGLSTGQVDLGSLVVSQGQDFTLTFGVSEAMLNLGAGATLNVPLTATGLNGFNGNIALLGQVIGAGASCFRFVGSYPASIPANSQTTISIQNNNCPGEVSLSFNFNGSAIGIRRYTNPVQVRNASAGDFNVGVGSPSPAVLTPQYRVTYPVTVSSTNGQTGNVSLSLNLNSFPLPAGVTYSLAPSVFLGGSVTSYLTLYGSTLTPPGTYPVQVVAMLGSTQRTTMFSLSTQVTTFQVTSATGSAIIHNTGQEVQVTHTVTAGTVPTSATCGSADPNVSCRVISTASGTVTLGITAATGATHGTRVLSLNGSAAKVHAAIANNGAQLTGLWPSNIYAGDPPTTATINVLGLEFCECTPELIVDAPVIGDIYDWGANISATFYAAPSTPAGLYGVWVNLCGGYWDAWDDINTEACVAGPLELQVNAAPSTVQVTPGPTFIMAYKDNLPSDQTLYCVPIQANGQPDGGSFSWSTSSQTVTLQNANTATVTVCSAVGKFSQNQGDVAVNVNYTVSGVPSPTATTTLTVLKPTTLVLNPGTDTTKPAGHTCIQGAGEFTDTQSYYEDSLSGARYTSYVRYRTYSVQDQFTTTIPWNMSLNESYIPSQANVQTGSGTGATAPDYFFHCSQTCRQGGTESVAATQTITANNFTIATKAVTWTCAGVAIQD